MRTANSKINVVFETICLHEAATRRCAIHLTKSSKYLQHPTTLFFLCSVDICTPGWAESSRGLWVWSLAVLQQHSNPYEVSKMFIWEFCSLLDNLRIFKACARFRNMCRIFCSVGKTTAGYCVSMCFMSLELWWFGSATLSRRHYVTSVLSNDEKEFLITK